LTDLIRVTVATKFWYNIGTPWVLSRDCSGANSVPF